MNIPKSKVQNRKTIKLATGDRGKPDANKKTEEYSRQLPSKQLKVTAGLFSFRCPSKQRGFRYPNVPAIDASTPQKKYSIHFSEFDSSNIGKNYFDREYAKAMKMKLE